MSPLWLNARQLQSEVLRFLVVGGCGFLVDFSVLVLCRDACHWNCTLAATVGYLIGLAFTYALNVNWVFRERRYDSVSAELGIFVGIGLMGLGVTQIMFAVGAEVLGLDYRAVKIVATVLVTLLNFVARKTLLFST